ncbi:MAG: response regulator transcription factor [Sneathiella sp.]|nr:response regulator transcription factor [Sneathiella sp.]
MRALIADKQDLFRQSLKIVLSEVVSTPITIFEAGCAKSFLASLRKEKISLILLGTNICFKEIAEKCEYEQIRLYQPHTPVLLIEDQRHPQSNQTPDCYPVEGVIHKTFAISSYKKAISQLLSGGRYFPSQAQTVSSIIPKENGELSKLTPRQREVLTLLAQGKSNKAIAEILNLSEGTVKVRVTAIFRVFSVRNRTQAMLLAQKMIK